MTTKIKDVAAAFRPGFRVPRDADAAATLREIERLAREHGGELGARDVLDAAKRRGSPLRPFFDWDTDHAAESWRMQQARMLLNAVNITIVPHGRPAVQVRAVIAVSPRPQQPEGPKYVPIVSALDDRDVRRRALDRAVRVELRAWCDRWRAFEELADVMVAAERVAARLFPGA